MLVQMGVCANDTAVIIHINRYLLNFVKQLQFCLVLIITVELIVHAMYVFLQPLLIHVTLSGRIRNQYTRECFGTEES
jgi:hypothetical protein